MFRRCLDLSRPRSLPAGRRSLPVCVADLQSGRGADWEHLPGFSRRAYDRFKLPRRFAATISGLDDPRAVPAPNAAHMRADDYVIGIELGDHRRAYPLWIIDNYHVVNDDLGGRRVAVMSCERCQSGAAFVAESEGDDRPLVFRAGGVYNATLTVSDLSTGSLWNHYEGVGLRGRSRGARLPWLPAWHIEWSDWVALHPGTEVLAPPEDPTHPDARHGHGREELFARPGIDPAFIPTIVGPLDEHYAENEMVLAVRLDDGWTAFPLQEVQRAGGVVTVDTRTEPVAVVAGPGAEGFTMAAYRSKSGDRRLELRRGDGLLNDQDDGAWTIDGRCVTGPLTGSRLEPIPWYYLRWHAWVYSHRNTKLWRCARACGYPEGDFSPALGALREAGHRVETVGPLVDQLRPRRAERSLVVTVDAHRLVLHAFRSESSARDFERLEGAFSCLPFAGTLRRSHVERAGRIVVQSDPPERFVDAAQVVPLADDVVRWAPLEELVSAMRGSLLANATDLSEASLADVLRDLRAAGLEVIEPGFLPPGQLRVGCSDGIGAIIEGDWFLVYLFEAMDEARSYSMSEEHSVRSGPFVFRSCPDTMYRHQAYEIAYAGDCTIRWSALFDDPRFLAALAKINRGETSEH